MAKGADPFYWGFMHVGAQVQKKGKNVEDDWYLCDHYLPYASGGGYVLSVDLVDLIVANSDILHLYNSEDISVGVWISPYEVERKHDERFNVLGGVCQYRQILSHWQSPDDIRNRYKGLHIHGNQCVIATSDMRT